MTQRIDQSDYTKYSELHKILQNAPRAALGLHVNLINAEVLEMVRMEMFRD